METKIKIIAFVVCVVVVFFLVIGPELFFKDSVIVEVTGKERITSRQTSKYLIFTKNETFQNTDFFLAGKFDSSDIYGKIEKGNIYRFDVAGVRIPFFSMYRNIHRSRLRWKGDKNK